MGFPIWQGKLICLSYILIWFLHLLYPLIICLRNEDLHDTAYEFRYPYPSDGHSKPKWNRLLSWILSHIGKAELRNSNLFGGIRKKFGPWLSPLMGSLSQVEAMTVSFVFGILKLVGCFDRFGAIRPLYDKCYIVLMVKFWPRAVRIERFVYGILKPGNHSDCSLPDTTMPSQVFPSLLMA